MGLCFIGDVMLGRQVGARVAPDSLVRSLTALRGTHDLVINLECVAAAAGAESALAHSAFAANAALLEALVRAGVTAANLANNHALDFGAAGLSATQRRLTELGVAPVGLRNGNEPAVWETRVDDAPVVVLGGCALTLPARVWDAGVVRADAPEFCDAIRRWSERGFSVIVSVHWGHERVTLPPPEARALARKFAAAGAALVVGHGPHVVQGHERIGGTAVYYSLGDAVFDRGDLADRDWGLVLIAERDGSGWRCRPEPFAIPADSHVPTLPAPAERAAQFAARSSVLEDEAAYRRAFNEQATRGFVGQQFRTTVRLVRKAGVRGLWEKARGVRGRHFRLLAHTFLRNTR